MKHIIQISRQQSRRSDVERARLSAIILTQSGEILAKACNMTCRGHMPKLTIHAEEMVILKANRKRIFQRYDNLQIFVARFRRNGSQAISKPCPKCLYLIKKLGIEYMIYFNEEGKITREKIN